MTEEKKTDAPKRQPDTPGWFVVVGTMFRHGIGHTITRLTIRTLDGCPIKEAFRLDSVMALEKGEGEKNEGGFFAALAPPLRQIVTAHTTLEAAMEKAESMTRESMLTESKPATVEEQAKQFMASLGHGMF